VTWTEDAKDPAPEPPPPIHPGHAPWSEASSWWPLIRRFSLATETDREGTVAQVRADAELHGGSAWALVFAILIASVGLNVNSPAVIIGAMLISPLMGPIVGAGFALATDDLRLLRQSGLALLVATIVALATSTLYFSVSPLADAQSELLARTRPTLYDVLIALFGGGAGAVAVTRKGTKGNAVPGVAIATALMPPLCTAGYGLAEHNFGYMLGALHLFSINALFIGLATLIFVRLMGFKPVRHAEAAPLARLRAMVALVILAVLVSSSYTAWNVVKEERFRHAAKRFVADQLSFPDRTVLDVDARYSVDGSIVHATVLGPPLSAETMASLQARLAGYGLANARLDLRQPQGGLASVEQIVKAVKQDVLDDASRRDQESLAPRLRDLEGEIERLRPLEFPVQALTREMAALHPGLVSLGVGREAAADAAVADAPLQLVVVASWRRLPVRQDQDRLRAFCAQRLAAPSLRLVNVSER